MVSTCGGVRNDVGVGRRVLVTLLVGSHLPEGHQAWSVANGGASVAGEVRDGDVSLGCGGLADADVHPRATPLVLGAGVSIEVEGGDVFVGLLVEDLRRAKRRVRY